MAYDDFERDQEQLDIEPGRRALIRQMRDPALPPREPKEPSGPAGGAMPEGPLPPSAAAPTVVDRSQAPPPSPLPPGTPTSSTPALTAGGQPLQMPAAPASGPQKSGNIQQDWGTFIGSLGAIPYQDFRNNLPQYVDQFNQQYGYGIRATGRPGDYDTIQLPDGTIVDVHSSSGQMIWNPEVAGGAPAGAGSTADPEIQQFFRQALLQILQGGSSNPALDRMQANYRRERTRGAQREREALAERSAFEGLNSGGQGSGAFDTGVQGINEAASEDIANYGGQLEYQDYQRQRQELMNGLQLAEAIGARNEANQIRLYLAQLDNQFRYASLNQQQGQFEDTTAFNYAQLQAELNRQALLAGLTG